METTAAGVSPSLTAAARSSCCRGSKGGVAPFPSSSSSRRTDDYTYDRINRQCVYAVTVLEGSTTQGRVWERQQFRFFGVRALHSTNLLGGR